MIFNSIKLVVILIAFIFSNAMQAILVTIAQASQDKQDIILISDNHGLKQDPKDQVNTLKECFLKFNEDDKFHVLIEGAPIISIFNTQKKTVLSSLMCELKELNLDNKLNIQNIEERLFSIAAHFLLAVNNPNAIPHNGIYKTEKNSCNLSKIKFADLNEEFKKFSNSIKLKICNCLDENIRNLAIDTLVIIEEKFKKFNVFLEKLHIQDNSCILDVAKKLDPINKHDTRNKIINIFSELADLLLFLRIQKIDKTTNIVIIAGYKHCENIKSLLGKSNYKLAYNAGNNESALETNELKQVFKNLRSDFFIV